MGRLPVVSGEQLIKALGKEGFIVVRRKGSHVSLRKGHLKTVVPLHEELAKGTLLAIARQCGFPREEIARILR